MQKIFNFISNLSIRKKITYIFISLFLTATTIVLTSTIYIGTFKKYIIHNPTTDQSTKIGIVFGSGVDNDGKPYKELQARLDTAVEALNSGLVEKLILSGDNRFLNYNEPESMINYLVNEKNIDINMLQPDYAGRSTYETCERAHKIFGVQKAILFSSYSHLPRAIFTCRSFGIESFGIGNGTEANNAGRREPLARVKAMFNVYILGEKTVLGDPIPFN